MASVWSTRLIYLIINSLGSSPDIRALLLCFVLFWASVSITFLLLWRKQCKGERANFGREGVGTMALARTGAWDNSCIVSSWGRERHAGAQRAFSFFLFIQSRTPTLAVILPMFRGVFLPQFSLSRGTRVSPTWLQIQSLEVNNHSTSPFSPVRKALCPPVVGSRVDGLLDYP